MKKFVSLAAALTLVLAMGLNVCAADSVSAKVTVTETKNASNVSSTVGTQENKTEATNNLETVAKVDAKEFTPVATLEVTGTIAPGQTAEITFGVPGVKAADTVVVLHKGAAGWDQRPATAGNGTVTAEFTSFSPVVIFVKEAAASQPSAGSAAQPAAGTASPKTADASMATAACVAVLAVAGLAISRKRFA